MPRKITELTLQNILKIRAVRIRPKDDVVKISGRNAAGKSSVLDGIEMVLRGRSAFPEKPIREGAEQGAGQIDLGDIIITRHLDPHRLIVKYKGDKEKISRPQEFLDSLLNKYTCDPLALLRLSPTDQLDEVKKVLGIDFTALDEEYDELYLQRRDIKRTLRSIEFQLKSMPEGDPPEEIIDTDELYARLEHARLINKENAQRRLDIEDLRRQVKSETDRLEMLKKEMSELENSIGEKTKRGLEIKRELENVPDIDESRFIDKIKNAEEIKSRVREYERRKKIEEEYVEENEKSEKIDARIEEINEIKRNAIRNAEFPVDGLEFGEKSLIYNGIPFDQASQAEKLRVCFALSMAGDPDIGVVLIREASLLDDENLKLISKIAAENDFQVWLERVDDSDEMSFVIEDGELIKSPDGALDEKTIPLF